MDCPPMAFKCKSILFFPGDAGHACNVLCRFAHRIGFDTNRPLIAHIRAAGHATAIEGHFDAALLPPEAAGRRTLFAASHVIEHLERPLDLVHEIAAAMKPGDLLYIEVPLHTGASFRKLGYRWTLWNREHLMLFSPRSLAWVAASGAEGIRKLTVRLELPRPTAGEIAVPLTDSPDDAEESAEGVVDLISSELELPREKAPQIIGLRFPKVPLAPGTRIKRAYVQFEAGKGSDEPTRLEIRGQAADDAPPFSTAAFNISQRPVTEAVAIWEPKAWTANAKPGSDHRSADLSQVVQEIVNRPGWKRGNAVALIIRGSGRRVATSTDGEQEGATTLVLELDQPPSNTHTRRNEAQQGATNRHQYSAAKAPSAASERRRHHSAPSNRMTEATAMAQAKMEELNGGQWTALVSGSDTVGAFTRTWTVTSPAGDMRYIDLVVNWEDVDGKNHQITLNCIKSL